MTQSDTSFPTLKLTGAEIKPALKSYAPVAINSDRGNISCRLYSSTAPTSCGILWLNSAVGGWISPAKNLYHRVGRLLTTMGMSSLQLRYRYPGNLHESALDALAGITFLQHQGCTSVAIVGHAFGGAVAIQAATAMPNVKCVVTLATQSMG